MAKEFFPDKYKVTPKETVYDGVHSEIDAVDVSVGDRKVPLLRKKHIGYSADFMDGAQAHSFLKKKGYPVFPTWRYDEEEEIDYITDLRRGGTHKVVDFCGHPDNYKKVFISNFDELKNDANILLEKLTNDGIVINEPNIFFDVEIATGKAKIILGDLREIGAEMDDIDDYDEAYIREKILESNKHVIDGHMSRLKESMIETLG